MEPLIEEYKKCAELVETTRKELVDEGILD